MDKEKILSQNKKENLYLDEYGKHIKLQGKSIGSVAFGSMGYEAHISKNKSKFVIALFFLLFMGYYFYKFLMVGL